MQIEPAKLFDSALLLAVTSGFLYSLGIASSAGEAAAIGLPYDFLRKDHADNLLLGIRGVVEILLAPVFFITQESERSLRLITLVLSVMFALLAWFGIDNPRTRLAVLIPVVYLACVSIVYVSVLGRAESLVSAQRACTVSAKCPTLNRVEVEADAGGGVRIYSGALFAVGVNNVVLINGNATQIIAKKGINRIGISPPIWTPSKRQETD